MNYFYLLFCEGANDVLLSGFFVDVNLFKESKERKAEIGKSRVGVVNSDNGNVGAVGADSLADEDANLMVKLKFLTYKVGTEVLITDADIVWEAETVSFADLT